VAATNRPNSIDAALRRPGRFDREVLLLPPTIAERATLLLSMCPGLDHQMADHVATATPGFLAADLVQLCGEVAKMSSRPGDLEFTRALRKIRPSTLRGAGLSGGGAVAVTKWSTIGGSHDAKKRLQMAVEWPLQHADTFHALGLCAPRGILLHGPPGCSKTMLVRAAATASHANFFHLSGADIFSCYIGEAERILRAAFDAARAAAPSIVFLDELDAIVGKRSVGGESSEIGNGVKDRVLSTLLTEMDGVSHARNVIVVGATNRIDLLDDALLRPGRFDDVIPVGLPDLATRADILRAHAGPRVELGVDYLVLADMLHGASGAQVTAVAQEAALYALREAEYGHQCAAMCRDVLSSTFEEVNVRMRHYISCCLSMQEVVK
jgi:transitional endoplasmic reticulum ATPase